MIRSIFFCILLILFFLTNFRTKKIDTIQKVVSEPRIINFAGYEWIVDNSKEKTKGPGPNYFSDSENNVWLDSAGRLHLKVTYKNNKWYFAKITTTKSYGYNKYVFYLDSRVDLLDKNMVVGLFTYENDTSEIDIEFSKWGDDLNMNSQYAIQPGYKDENKERFDINYKKSLQTIHSIDWKPSEIRFLSLFQNDDESSSIPDTIHSWKYTGKHIPTHKNEKIKINFWLFRGNPPTKNYNCEVIISDFKILEKEFH